MFASGRARLVGSMLALIPAACAGPIATRPVVVEAPQVIAAAVAPPTSEPLAAAPPVPVLEPVQETTAPPPPPPRPPRNDIELRAVYGAPSFARREPESELWRYDGAACTLFVFLYRVSEGVLVRHMETLPRNADMTADEACLASIRDRKIG